MSKTILIAEDNMLISMVLEKQVRRMNHRVAGPVSTAEEAIKAAEEQSPELILMDIQLKDGMDGIDAMSRIRENSEVPVIYISGNSDRYNLKRARETRYVEYMVKPIRIEDLELAIKKALHGDKKQTG